MDNTHRYHHPANDIKGHTAAAGPFSIILQKGKPIQLQHRVYLVASI